MREGPEGALWLPSGPTGDAELANTPWGVCSFWIPFKPREWRRSIGGQQWVPEAACNRETDANEPFLVSRASCTHIPIQSPQLPWKVAITIPLVKMRKLRLQEVKQALPKVTVIAGRLARVTPTPFWVYLSTQWHSTQGAAPGKTGWYKNGQERTERRESEDPEPLHWPHCPSHL